MGAMTMLDEMDKQAITQNLADAGCCDEMIECILKSMQSENGRCMKQLEKHRGVLLDALHENQRQIDCLDYLMWKLKKREEAQNNESNRK